MSEVVETRLRSVSPPMDYRFTAVATAPDSTTRNSGSDPVSALSYRQVNNDVNNNNTTSSASEMPPRNTGT